MDVRNVQRTLSVETELLLVHLVLTVAAQLQLPDQHLLMTVKVTVIPQFCRGPDWTLFQSTANWFSGNPKGRHLLTLSDLGESEAEVLKSVELYN